MECLLSLECPWNATLSLESPVMEIGTHGMHSES